jgi:hypothetical protein
MVMALAGLRMSWDEMRQIVRNPHSDQPIAKATFARVFRRELAEGGARLKELISRSIATSLLPIATAHWHGHRRLKENLEVRTAAGLPSALCPRSRSSKPGGKSWNGSVGGHQ